MPQPDSPTSPTIWPRSTVRLAPATARTRSRPRRSYTTSTSRSSSGPLIALTGERVDVAGKARESDRRRAAGRPSCRRRSRRGSAGGSGSQAGICCGLGGVPLMRRAAVSRAPRDAAARRAARACTGGAGGGARPPWTGLDHAARRRRSRSGRRSRTYAEVVRDQDDRELVLAPQAVEQPQDPRLHRHVERRRRLVRDQQPRPAGERDRDRDPLAHPAGELVRVGVQGAARIGDAHLVEQLDGARRRPPAGRARDAGACARSAAGRSRASGGASHRVLEHHPDLAARHRAQVAAAQAQQVLPPKSRATFDDRAGRQQAEQREHRHRLAAAALTRHAEDLGRIDLVVDAVDDVASPRGVGSRTRSPSTSNSAVIAASSRAHDVCGSKRSRRLSPRKLNASTAVKIASPGNVPIHHHWKYWRRRRPSTPIRPAAAGRRGRGTRGPESSRIAFAEVERREHEHRPGDVRQDVAEERAASRGAEQPRRLDVLRVPDREDEPADDARIRAATRRRRWRARRSGARGRAPRRRPSRG